MLTAIMGLAGPLIGLISTAFAEWLKKKAKEADIKREINRQLREIVKKKSNSTELRDQHKQNIDRLMKELEQA